MKNERRYEAGIESGASRENSMTFGRRDLAVSAGPISIWLADDRPGILELIAELMESNDGFRCVRQFPSAEAVLDALKSETPPDAILMDVNMGGMTGVEAIRPIKSLAGETRVFIMTTFYDSTVVSGAREAGAAGFLLKSGDWQDAVERILDPSRDWLGVEKAEVQASDFDSAEAAAKIPSESPRAGGQPLLARGFALARAFFTRTAYQESSLPQ